MYKNNKYLEILIILKYKDCFLSISTLYFYNERLIMK